MRWPRIRIGVSSCLLGEEVRFNGGHKRDDFVVRTVGQFVDFVPVCPEVEIGLGTPRETIRLVDTRSHGLRLLGSKSRADHTAAMQRYARAKARELKTAGICGYIFKKGSPSCGVFRVKVYTDSGMPARGGRGLFAAAVTEAMPLLPVEEEGRLHDPRLRESFFERVFAYRRVTDFFASRWRRGDLVRFHTAEKILMLAHDRQAYTELGRLVARVKQVPRAELASRYQQHFLAGLEKIATTRKQSNVLQHMSGHLKKILDTDERAELRELIEDFRLGLVPLVVPVTLIRHHVRHHGIKTLAGQTYLEPHPKELMLRNHV